MQDPKYKIGEEVIWNKQKFVIQGFRNYQDYCWVYDFFPSRNTNLPFHFTGISEGEISPINPEKRWWEFWK